MKHLKKYPRLFPKELNDDDDWIDEEDVYFPFSEKEINTIENSLQKNWRFQMENFSKLVGVKVLKGKEKNPVHNIVITFVKKEKKNTISYTIEIFKIEDEYFPISILQNSKSIYERFFMADQIEEVLAFLEQAKNFYHSEKTDIKNF
jgi:hypothetical protein